MCDFGCEEDLAVLLYAGAACLTDVGTVAAAGVLVHLGVSLRVGAAEVSAAAAGLARGGAAAVGVLLDLAAPFGAGAAAVVAASLAGGGAAAAVALGDFARASGTAAAAIPSSAEDLAGVDVSVSGLGRVLGTGVAAATD